jgi:hypothetical protein
MPVTFVFFNDWRLFFLPATKKTKVTVRGGRRSRRALHPDFLSAIGTVAAALLAVALTRGVTKRLRAIPTLGFTAASGGLDARGDTNPSMPAELGWGGTTRPSVTGRSRVVAQGRGKTSAQEFIQSHHPFNSRQDESFRKKFKQFARNYMASFH